MKAVILAGGLGTRISEETSVRPKPMVEIGGKPILWHIMKLYSSHGVNEFIICCGYKGYVIKEYFSNYFLHMSDVTFDLPGNRMEVHQNYSEPWKVTLVDTGEHTMTGGRLKRVREFLEGEDTFCFTYGDGLSDVDIAQTIEFYSQHKGLATMTVVKPPSRYGAVDISEGLIKNFVEKPIGQNGLINGGFFVLSTSVIEYIKDDSISWENEPLAGLAKDGQLHAYRHDGFWQPMDTLREKMLWKICGKVETRHGR